jgi:hypothetical protein
MEKDLSASVKNFSSDKLIYYLNYVMNKYYSDKENISKIAYVKELENLYVLTLNTDGDSFNDLLIDLLDYGLERYQVEFFEHQEGFKIHFQYTRKQFMSTLNIDHLAFREGIKFHKNELYLFIDIKKDENKAEHLKYEDEIIDEKTIKWESSTNSTLENTNGKKLINKNDAHVFIRKTKKEDGLTLPYIYLGKGLLKNPRKSKNHKKTLLFDISFDSSLPSYI